jgi:fluoride exporter
MIVVYMAIGGVIGTLLRYAVGAWIHNSLGTWLPWGTLVINITGSFALGFAMRTFEHSLVTPELRAFMVIGFCGAFTTFSSYSYETFALIQQGNWVRAGFYSIGSVLLCLLGVAVGVALAATMMRGRFS